MRFWRCESGVALPPSQGYGGQVASRRSPCSRWFDLSALSSRNSGFRPDFSSSKDTFLQIFRNGWNQESRGIGFGRNWGEDGGMTICLYSSWPETEREKIP